MKSLLKSISPEDLIRLIIGSVLIFAAIPKIIDPLDFAFNLAGYQLFPEFSLQYMAVFVPYLELLTGIFLIVGVYVRGALFLAIGMFVVFIFSLLYAIAQGVDINCGCFGQVPGEKSNLWFRVAEDFIYITGLLYVANKEKIFKTIR